MIMTTVREYFNWRENGGGQDCDQDMAGIAACFANHCVNQYSEQLFARIAELEAALSEARSWIGDGEDSICSFAYPKQCSSDYVEMVNRVDAVLGKGGAA
jgi:hypothetical protein